MLLKNCCSLLSSASAKPSRYSASHSLQGFRLLLNKLLPRHCLFCLQQTANKIPVCEPCLLELPANIYHCQRCAAPLEIIHSINRINSQLCGNCLSHHYFYDQVYSPYLYRDGVSFLIRKFKYQQKLYYASLLAELFQLGMARDNLFKLPEVMIPMPMHPLRLKQRGYNQAMELTRVLARHFNRPICHNALLRSRNTSLQAGLTARQRQTNVSNAFAVKKPILYKHAALIDDVMTTGSTVNEAARILKKQTGVKQIDVWTIARA